MSKQPKSQHITRQQLAVSRMERERLMGHRGVTIWFTGLSASGKSTVANLADQALTSRAIHCAVLDGDNVRHGLNRDLGFSPADREENIRRIGEVAKIMSDAGLVVLTAFISPYRRDRDTNREIHPPGGFVEVFVDSPLQVCEERDPRGLYRRARRGEIPEFTGVSAPYEPPLHPEVVLQTAVETPEESCRRMVAWLEQRGYLVPP